MDIIVTTPKSQMKNAAKEAQLCIDNDGGYYFRRLSFQPKIIRGEKIWYVEDGFIRGYAILQGISYGNQICEVSGEKFKGGVYLWMDATTWTWIEPYPMRGFQGFRYFDSNLINTEYLIPCGDWKSRRPPDSKRRVNMIEEFIGFSYNLDGDFFEVWVAFEPKMTLKTSSYVQAKSELDQYIQNYKRPVKLFIEKAEEVSRDEFAHQMAIYAKLSEKQLDYLIEDTLKERV